MATALKPAREQGRQIHASELKRATPLIKKDYL